MRYEKLPDPRFKACTAGGETLFVHRCGHGPRLVLLHGGPGLDHHLLVPLAEQLADRFEIWIPDLPGHGASRQDNDPFPGLRAVLDPLGRWLDGLATELADSNRSFILAGHSLGAWLAREYVRFSSSKPAGLILIAPPSRPGKGESPPVRARVRAVDPMKIPGGGQNDNQQARDELLLYLQLATPGALSERFHRAVEESRLFPPWKYNRLVRRLHKELLRPGIQVDPCCPTLVLCGREDRITTPEQARDVARFTTDSVRKILANKGHFPWADGSRETAEEILRFLS